MKGEKGGNEHTYMYVHHVCRDGLCSRLVLYRYF
jgi:hypothetical protein